VRSVDVLSLPALDRHCTRHKSVDYPRGRTVAAAAAAASAGAGSMEKGPAVVTVSSRVDRIRGLPTERSHWYIVNFILTLQPKRTGTLHAACISRLVPREARARGEKEADGCCSVLQDRAGPGGSEERCRNGGGGGSRRPMVVARKHNGVGTAPEAPLCITSRG
jgi:hypothetical protein